MKTKEEVIKEAWGLDYESVNNRLTDDGWFDYYHLNPDEKRIKFSKFDSSVEMEEHKNLERIRPKSLRVVINNNGWIKINSLEDLPTGMGLIDNYVFKSQGKHKDIIRTYRNSDVRILWEQEEITHYQQIIKPNPPLHD